MKLAVISDLHSNKEALEAVLAHIESLSGITSIVCLGDVVGYGPDPEYCVDVVRGHASWCLMGNHDEALFRGATDFNPHARGAIEYTRRIMEPSWWSLTEKRARWKWLKRLPLKMTEGPFLFVHGSPRDPVREYVLSTDGFLNPGKLGSIFELFERICVAGHTHQPGVHDQNFNFTPHSGDESSVFEFEPEGKYFVNVGSTGQPRDGDVRACYAVLTPESVTWHRVEYDFQTTMDKIDKISALHPNLARRLAIGK